MRTCLMYLSIFLISLSSIQGQTDLKIYGFSGKVKIVKYFVYNEISILEDSSWDRENSILFSEKKLCFDKSGNLDSMVESFHRGRFFEKYITYYNHSSNRLKSSKKYRYYTNELIEEMNYTWTDGHQKCKFKGVGIKSFTKGERVLYYNHREKKGSYRIESMKGVLQLKESYKNESDGYWNLIQTKYSNANTGDYNIL